MIDYKRVQRVEQFMFHPDAFRELLINAIVHKDYSSCNPIQISVYENQIYIGNSGEMPKGLSTSAKLYRKHTSIPYNPRLAEIFFKSGMIEAWGRSFEKIREACEEYEGPLPKVRITENEVMVHCLPSERYTRLLNTNNSIISNERIMSELMSGKTGKSISIILDYLETHSEITSTVAAEITNKSETQGRRYLNLLEKMGRIKRTKTTKGNVYIAL